MPRRPAVQDMEMGDRNIGNEYNAWVFANRLCLWEWIWPVSAWNQRLVGGRGGGRIGEKEEGQIGRTVTVLIPGHNNTTQHAIAANMLLLWLSWSLWNDLERPGADGQEGWKKERRERLVVALAGGNRHAWGTKSLRQGRRVATGALMVGDAVKIKPSM